MKSPVRLERRLEQPRQLSWIIPLVSLLGALVVGAIVLLATGKNPLDVYWRMLDRGFFSQRALTGTLRTATPLAFTGLARRSTQRDWTLEDAAAAARKRFEGEMKETGSLPSRHCNRAKGRTA